MSQKRTKDYLDLYLSDKDMRKLRKGYTILKHHKDNHVAIHRNPYDRKTARQVQKLKDRIRVLEGKKGRK